MGIVLVKLQMRLAELPKHATRLTAMWGANPHPYEIFKVHEVENEFRYLALLESCKDICERKKM